MSFFSGLFDRAPGEMGESTSVNANASSTSYGSDEGPKRSRFREWFLRDEEPKEGLDVPERFAYLENAKALLITAVVWTSALEDFLSTSVVVNAESLSVRRTKLEILEPALPWIRALYLTLGAFSMPMFIAICGFQSKSWVSIAREPDAMASTMLTRVRQSTAALIGAWVLWQALYCVLEYAETRPLQWWAPIDVTWFLLALWIWRNSILLFGGMRDGVMYSFLFGLAIVVGFTDTPTTSNGLVFLDWQRVCTYSLYFYSGALFFQREHLDRVLKWFQYTAKSWVRFALGVIGLGVAYFGFLLADHLGEPFAEVSEWLFAAAPYGFTEWYHPFREAFMRMLLYLIVAFCSAAFMCLVPTDEWFFTQSGSRTLTAYLLHRVFITVYFKLTTKFWDDDDIDVVTQIVMGVFVLPLVVSQATLARPVTKLFAPLVDPADALRGVLSWMFVSADSSWTTTSAGEIVADETAMEVVPEKWMGPSSETDERSDA